MPELPDLLLTGEMSHHETLGVVERGSVVVALAHSNSERGYLNAVLRGKLVDALREEWEQERKRRRVLENNGSGGGEGLEEALRDEEVIVDVSLRDRDPFGIMMRRG